jgi:hypothetical protein
MALLVAIGVAATAIGVVLLAPWRFDLYVEKPGDSAQVRVRAHLHGIVFGWWLPAKRVATSTSPRTRRVSVRPALIRAVLSTPGFITRTFRLFRDIGRQAWPRAVSLRARIGLDDPADTGALLGAWYGVTRIASSPRWNVRLEPDFTGRVIDFEGHAHWSVRPIAIIWPFVLFAGSPIVWRAARAALRARRL